MQEYQAPYLVLWRGIAKALEAMEAQNYGMAREMLTQAQANAEEAFLSWQEAAPAADS